MNLQIIAILALAVAVSTSSGTAQNSPSAPAAQKPKPAAPDAPDSPQKAAKKKQAAKKKKEVNNKLIIEKTKVDEADGELLKAASSFKEILSKNDKHLKPLLVGAPKVTKKSSKDVDPEVAVAAYVDSPAFDPQGTLKANPEVVKVAQVVKTAAVKVKASKSKKEMAAMSLAGLEAMEKNDRQTFEAEFGKGAWDSLVP